MGAEFSEGDGGLRVGRSIAPALSVPRNMGGGWIITSTYVMVVFSIQVQGEHDGPLPEIKAAPDHG